VCIKFTVIWDPIKLTVVLILCLISVIIEWLYWL